MADGSWQMADGRWQMADGRWQMADGRWQIADGREQSQATYGNKTLKVRCMYLVQHVVRIAEIDYCLTH